MIAFRPRRSYNVCEMNVNSPAPATFPRRPQAGVAPVRAGIRQSAGALPYLVGRLLFWLLAVGMASELPLGSSWPESSRAARAFELRDSLLTASPAVTDDDDSTRRGESIPDLVQAAPDLGDEPGLSRFQRLPARLASFQRGDSFEAAPARRPYAWASARAPPFLGLG
jgi:hypothetical protein